MSYRQVNVINCRTASIRKAPWITPDADEIVGEVDGNLKFGQEVKSGKTIEIDPDNFCYDWTGRKFYKVLYPDGWIYEGCISLETSSDDGE